MSPTCCEDIARPTSLPEGIDLRVMKASDLPHVRTLHRNLLPVSYPAAFFVQLLINPLQLCLVAIDRGTIIGFASAAMGPSQCSSGRGYVRDTFAHAERECSEPCSEIPRTQLTLLTLGVLPAYQRRGIGRCLVHGVVQRLEASRATAAQPYLASSDHIPDQDNKIAVLVQVQVAQSNSAGKCFYTHLGMMDQPSRDDTRLRLGPGSGTNVMAGVLCMSRMSDVPVTSSYALEQALEQ